MKKWVILVTGYKYCGHAQQNPQAERAVQEEAILYTCIEESESTDYYNVVR